MLNKLYAKLTSFNKEGGEKGFTLVELMIVIAVIAILALVLLPKAGIVKDRARESGVDVNINLLTAEVNSVIDNFTTDDVELVETRIATDINNALETIDKSVSQKLKNPITGIAGCVEVASIATGGAVVYIVGSDDDETTVDNSWPEAGGANYKGVVGFAAYANSETGKVQVKLYPYDSAGNLMVEKEKIISQ